MIKGALFDIDDTVYSHKIKDVPSLSLRAIDKLREKDIKIGICTSRKSCEMVSLPSYLLDRIDCQIMDTGAVTLIKNKYYKAYSIDPSQAIKYTKFFEEHNISYGYSDINGDTYFCGDKSLVTDKGVLSWAKGNVMFKEYESEEVSSIMFLNRDPNLVEEIKNINPTQYISWWTTTGIISPNYVDKSFGLLKFCQMYSFTPDEVIAFGDGGNDDLMLQMAGIGIATDDANEKAKKVADYICRKSIEDGGLYEALLDLKILDEEKYNPKIFFFDIDSTIYDHSIHNVRDKTYEALQKLKDKGYKLCLNTSRSYEEMYNVPKRLLDMMDCLILLSGAYILKDGQVHVKYMDDDQTKKCIEYMDDNDITYRYCTDDGVGYLNRHDEDKENLFYTLYNMTPDIKKYNNEKVLDFIFYVTDKRRDELLQIMNNSEFSFLKLGGEFYPKEVDKGFALIDVAKMYGFSQKQTCAFGDGDNDCTMLKKAYLGVAMGNATKMCKQSADYVTDDISDEGLYKALIHFGFIED